MHILRFYFAEQLLPACREIKIVKEDEIISSLLLD